MKYGMVVFREGIVIDDKIHGEMQSNFHPNEWVQYTFQSQYVIQSQRDQDGARTFVVPDQPPKISSRKS